MSELSDPVDRLLRAVVGTPHPTSEERASSRAQFQRAIAGAADLRRPALRWPQLAIAAGLLIVIAGAVLTLSTRSAVASAFEEIAAVVETIEPLQAPDDGYIFTESDQLLLVEVPPDGLGGLSDQALLYQLPTRRLSWLGNEGTLQVATTNLEPIFFSAADLDLYYAAGVDQRDAIGVTETVTIPDADTHDWSSDPDVLDSQIRQLVPTGTARPESIEYLDTALLVVRESFSSPETRSAALRLIATIEDIELLDERTDGTTRFSVDFTEEGVDVGWVFAIDALGYVREEVHTNLTPDPALGLQAGVITFKSEYSAPTVVDSLDSG